MQIQVNKLLHHLQMILFEHGVSEEDAKIVSEILIEGDLRGYTNHGVERIFQILTGIRNKTINPQTSYQIIRDNISTAVIDGKHSLGYPIGKKAMDLAVSKAKKSGLGMVGVINCSHLGVLSYYAELASSAHMIGIVMSTSSAAVVLKGGNIKTLGTNPLCYSIPHTPHPITADFATSKVARGTIYEHLEKNEPIPSGWAVDGKGTMTTCPKEALKGGLQPMDGDIKGGLFSLLISILAGHLIGGEINPNVTGTRDMSQHPNKGDLFLALDIDSLTEKGRFDDKTSELVNFVSAQQSDFRIPGDRAHEVKKNSNQHGIEISPKLRELIVRYTCLNK